MKCLIVDEADRVFDAEFERDMRQILNILPKKKQTMLFSATVTAKVRATFLQLLFFVFYSNSYQQRCVACDSTNFEVENFVKDVIRSVPLRFGPNDSTDTDQNTATVSGLQQVFKFFIYASKLNFQGFIQGPSIWSYIY